ncbi:inactive phospholipase C-like protein 1 [Branchiostoma lanceolatum]|uniref:inactive phospholipase C-like protein 1 n=1 Tax=Branchiostoma lanceolatum TaxID=7740 RepID=UPI0034523708
MADSTARPAVPTLEITEAAGKADGDPEPYVPNGAAASAGEGGAQLAPPGSGSPTGEGPRPRRSSLKKRSVGEVPTEKKSVSFTSMPSEKTIANASDCLQIMQNGTELIKIRSNVRQYQRLFLLDQGSGAIRWQPSKKGDKARIPVESIKEVRRGKHTDTFRHVGVQYPDECSFSIIHGNEFETLDLVAYTPDEANIWITGLTCLISQGDSRAGENAIEATEEVKETLRDTWLKKSFRSLDKSNSGFLESDQIISLAMQLDCDISIARVKHKLKELSVSRGEDNTNAKLKVSSSEFVELFKEVSTRPEIYFLMVRYGCRDFLTAGDLHLFLEAEQGTSNVTKEKCLEIISTFEPSEEGRERGQIGIDGFTKYLLSSECDIFDEEHSKIHQDMTHPLSHYYVFSSHDSYLLPGVEYVPSLNAYARLLQRGCRYVELVCWDGEHGDDEPLVCHHPSETTRLRFKSVVEIIAQYAFQASDYPLIIGIDNHCCEEQQIKIVNYIAAAFGDMLVRSIVEEGGVQLPSPYDLKKKVLVMGKKNVLPMTSTQSSSSLSSTNDMQNALSTVKVKREKGRPPLCKELADLIVLCKSDKIEDLPTSASESCAQYVCSFSQSGAIRLAVSFPEEFVNYNKKYMSEVHPDSNKDEDAINYNPQDYWNCGCQIVTVNYHMPGLMTDLNDGRFLENGSCGYVLKPSIMRDEIAYFSANTREGLPGVTPQILHVRIISGQQFPKPRGSTAKGDIIDPYIVLEIFGIPADCVEARTRAVPQNGYNPVFDESFEFQINFPEVALVRFVVLDEEFIGDDFIGQCTIPFECLQTGYRHIRLMSSTGDQLESATLFVHIAITNKRGGGKPTKRGLSVKKSKKRPEYTSLRNVGVRIIDDCFKGATPPLQEAAKLRENVQVAMTTFKESCGVPQISTLMQCVRTLISRFTATGDVSIVLKGDGQFPILEASGNAPEVLKKALSAFDVVVSTGCSLVDKADSLRQEMLDRRKAGLDFHEKLQELSSKEGLKGRKLTRALENFAWNIRVLQGQADLIQAAKNECLDNMKQVQETAVATGVIVETKAETKPT